MSDLIFTFEVGAFIRGECRRQIERGAWQSGLSIKTEESKGFFNSVYRFTVTGTTEELDIYRMAVVDYVERLKAAGR